MDDNEDDGATAVEYALLASLVCAVLAATVAVLGQRVLALFNTMAPPWL
jgi:Flp pilus assembly pilin Flp